MNSIYSVGQVNTYIKNMFDQDFMLKRIYIKGEVSNCKYHTSGHIYFSLKDETGSISCVMFAGQRKGLAFPMKNGDRVVAGGSVSVYERDGKYQLYAREITLEGAGLLYERFLALKKELEEMGMFAQEYKRPIPSYARKIGIVTAPTGAAIQDIRNIAGRRNPYVQLILYPALVQGEGAAESIVTGLETLDRLGVDVILVGRGGGSITTIADYVADLRAPTPSGAAELAVADVRIFFNTLDNYQQKMNRAMENHLLFFRQNLKYYQTRLEHGSPGYRIREMRMRLIEWEEKIENAMENQIYLARQKLNIYIERMKGLSPLDKLNQGFSYVEDSRGHAVTEISQAEIGDLVTIRVTDGALKAQIKEKEPEERNI